MIPSVLCFNCVSVWTSAAQWLNRLHIRANASWKLMTSRRAWFKSSHKASGFRLSTTNNYCTHSTIIFNIHRFKKSFFWLLTGTNEKSLCNSLQYSALTQSLCQISSCPTQLCSSCCVKTQNVRVYPPSPVLIVLKQTTINDDNYTREIHWRKEKAFTVTNQRYNGA